MPDFDVRVTHRESGGERIVRVRGARDGEHAREQAATDVWVAGPASAIDKNTKPMAVLTVKSVSAKNSTSHETGSALPNSDSARTYTGNRINRDIVMLLAGGALVALGYLLAETELFERKRYLEPATPTTTHRFNMISVEQGGFGIVIDEKGRAYTIDENGKSRGVDFYSPSNLQRWWR